MTKRFPVLLASLLAVSSVSAPLQVLAQEAQPLDRIAAVVDERGTAVHAQFVVSMVAVLPDAGNAALGGGVVGHSVPLHVLRIAWTTTVCVAVRTAPPELPLIIVSPDSAIA